MKVALKNKDAASFPTLKADGHRLFPQVGRFHVKKVSRRDRRKRGYNEVLITMLNKQFTASLTFLSTKRLITLTVQN